MAEPADEMELLPRNKNGAPSLDDDDDQSPPATPELRGRIQGYGNTSSLNRRPGASVLFQGSVRTASAQIVDAIIAGLFFAPAAPASERSLERRSTPGAVTQWRGALTFAQVCGRMTPYSTSSGWPSSAGGSPPAISSVPRPAIAMCTALPFSMLIVRSEHPAVPQLRRHPIRAALPHPRSLPPLALRQVPRPQRAFQIV